MIGPCKSKTLEPQIGSKTKIKSSCEADLGIIAANLALSQMIYLFIRNRRRRLNDERGTTTAYQDRWPSSQSYSSTLKRKVYRIFRSSQSQELEPQFNDQIPLGSIAVTSH